MIRMATFKKAARAEKSLARCPYCIEGGKFKVMTGRSVPPRLGTRALGADISGGTSSGKTTLANVLTEFISNDERIVLIEDTVEIQITKRMCSDSRLVRSKTVWLR
jgi:Type II/IV secretion system protein